MSYINYIIIAIAMLFSFTSCNSKIKNVNKVSVKIWGNCDMCKKTIETAGNKKNEALVVWNKDTKQAGLEFDSTKTNANAILKRIALAGYDNITYLAPDDIYAKLPECCQYERNAKPITNPNDDAIIDTTKAEAKRMTNYTVSPSSSDAVNQLKSIFDYYFAVKDALVKKDGNTASVKAKALLASIKVVKMQHLNTEEHIVWMKLMKDLASDAQHIVDTKDIALQRNHFMNLSKNMFDLLKVSKQETTIYYQFCPMANDGKGSNWLSKENVIKNPYYGSEMLHCGKTVEIIK